MLYKKVEKIINTLKKFLIPSFCLVHMAAILGWSLPNDFSPPWVENDQPLLLNQDFAIRFPDASPRLALFLHRYIDFTGSQQYWDFFAPQSPKYHQYLSICESIETDPAQGKTSCKGQPGFSNLDAAIEEGHAAFKAFGSDRSRYYRLSENLSRLEYRDLLETFTRYYGFNGSYKGGAKNTAYLVLHLFELHPELDDLPKAGYRMDKILLRLP